MNRRAIFSCALGALAGCGPGAGELAFSELQATPLSCCGGSSLARSADGQVAFGANGALWIQRTRGETGRSLGIPGTYVSLVGEHLVVAGGNNGGPGAVFFTSDDGWETLTEAGSSPLSFRHVSFDGERVSVTGGTEVLVMDAARFLAGAGEEEADVTLRWEIDAPAPWEGTVVASALRDEVLWIAAGDGVRGYDIGVDPPDLLYVLGDHDAYGVHLADDALLVRQNEDGVKIDVSDPFAPRIAGRLLGGEAVDVTGGYAFGVSSTQLTVSRMGAPADRPEPVRQLPLEACLAVTALEDRVLVSCDDQGTFELAPLRP